MKFSEKYPLICKPKMHFDMASNVYVEPDVFYSAGAGDMCEVCNKFNLFWLDSDGMELSICSDECKAKFIEEHR